MRGGDVLQGDRAIPAGSRVNLQPGRGRKACCVLQNMACSPLQQVTTQAASILKVLRQSCAMHGLCQADSPHAEACWMPRLAATLD